MIELLLLRVLMRAEKLRRRQLPFRIAGDLGGLQTAVLSPGLGRSNRKRRKQERAGECKAIDDTRVDLGL
jgi:hypothetical protein